MINILYPTRYIALYLIVSLYRKRKFFLSYTFSSSTFQGDIISVTGRGNYGIFGISKVVLDSHTQQKY
jgi:hypothetical protein